MITHERYIQITGDTTTTEAKAERCIADAVEALEDYLDRPLPEAERTETMRPDRNGRLWPKATPIIEADDYTIEGIGLAGTFGPAVDFFTGSVAVEVVYTGGWADPRDEDYDPTATNQLPACIERDLAWAAFKLAHPSATREMALTRDDATSVRLGDAAVTLSGSAGSPSDLDGCWSKRTRSHRWAPIHSTESPWARV